MKIGTILFCLLFFIALCKGQGAKNQFGKSDNIEKQPDSIAFLLKTGMDNEKMITKKFDITRFNKNSDGSAYEFITDNVKVEQIIDDDYDSGKINGYIERRSYLKSPYTFSGYYNASGNLVESSMSFYDIITGHVKEYDSSGKVIKERDFDTDYPFSIEMLIDKMRNEYNVDIMIPENCQRVTRGIYKDFNNIPLYEVWIKNNTESGIFVCYLINGNTGETLFTTTRYPNEKRGSLFNEYLNSLKEGNAKATGVSLNGGETNSLATEDFPEI